MWRRGNTPALDLPITASTVLNSNLWCISTKCGAVPPSSEHLLCVFIFGLSTSRSQKTSHLTCMFSGWVCVCVLVYIGETNLKSQALYHKTPKVFLVFRWLTSFLVIDLVPRTSPFTVNKLHVVCFRRINTEKTWWHINDKSSSKNISRQSKRLITDHL